MKYKHTVRPNPRPLSILVPQSLDSLLFCIPLSTLPLQVYSKMEQEEIPRKYDHRQSEYGAAPLLSLRNRNVTSSNPEGQHANPCAGAPWSSSFHPCT